MPIKVFISHKGTDCDLAERVARRVRSNGMDTYPDTIDDALTKDGPDLEDLLLDRMSSCQQLIAVVSLQTSYLTKWPALHSDRDLDPYCQYSKSASIRVARKMGEVFTEERRVMVRNSDAQEFHLQLKDVL